MIYTNKIFRNNFQPKSTTKVNTLTLYSDWNIKEIRAEADNCQCLAIFHTVVISLRKFDWHSIIRGCARDSIRRSIYFSGP